LAKKGAKIGEGHVSIHADMDSFNRGLDELEKKTQATVEKISQEATTSLSGLIASIPLMIFTASKAFARGTMIGQFIRDVMDARILVQDLRRELGAPGDALFSKAQGEKSSLILDGLRQQVSEIGDAEGGVGKIIEKQYEIAAKAIEEERKKSVQAVIDNAEDKKNASIGNLYKVAIGMVEGLMEDPFASNGGYRKVLADIREAEAAGIATANNAAKELLKTIDQIRERQTAIEANKTAQDLFLRQEQQRGMFNLGQTALDPTVLSRELGRVYSNGGRY